MNSNEPKYSRLAEALRKSEPAIFVPPSIDDAILKHARQRIQGEHSERPAFPWHVLWRTIFASLAVIVLLLSVSLRHRKQFAREDINRDGQIDILDAMALAKAVESNAAGLEFDQNADRKVDQADINRIAVRAVQL